MKKPAPEEPATCADGRNLQVLPVAIPNRLESRLEGHAVRYQATGSTPSKEIQARRLDRYQRRTDFKKDR